MGGLLMHYRWTSLTAFTNWHNAICAELGIPHPNHNAATGEIDENAQWTTAYTEPIIVSDDDVRAVVEDHVAPLVAGLGEPSEPPPTPEDLFNV
jgi:hypothetical protein